MILATLKSKAWQIVSGILAGIVLMLWVQLHGLPIIGGGMVSRLERMTQLRQDEAASHRTTKDNFRRAMAEAKRLEVFRLTRVKAEQQRISDHAQDDYERRLDALRTRYDGLRRQSGAHVTSAAGSLDVSGLPKPAFGADATPDADGLSAALMCSTYAVQLDELISWVERQSAINPNEE
jgi:hypothetical protein